jgi:hypothetical protein
MCRGDRAASELRPVEVDRAAGELRTAEGDRAAGELCALEGNRAASELCGARDAGSCSVLRAEGLCPGREVQDRVAECGEKAANEQTNTFGVPDDENG